MIAFRETAFADPEVVKLLTENFVSVGIAHNGAGRRKDAEGDFARKMIGSGGTLQGLHVINTAGELVGYVYDFRPESVRHMLKEALKKFKPVEATPIDFSRKDPRFVLPEGGLVVEVTSKVLGGYGEIESKPGGDSTNEKMARAWKTSMGRERLWIRKDEADALDKGELPETLKKRIARFHLLDNTRGTPADWKAGDIKKLEMTLKGGRLQGTVHLANASGDRGYEAQLLGFVEVKDGKVTRFDVVARGSAWGEGAHTPNAPKGKFPLGVAFTLADPKDRLYKLVPDAIRCFPGYME